MSHYIRTWIEISSSFPNYQNNIHINQANNSEQAFDVFITGQGAQGLLSHPSRQELETVFGSLNVGHISIFFFSQVSGIEY